MNDNLIFWRNWSVKEKAPLFLGLTAVIFLAIYAVYSWLNGLENIISMDVLTELKEKPIQSGALFFDQFSFSSTTPLWYVEESYAPSFIRINSLAYYLLLGATLLGVSFILSGLSRLKGVWFLAGALILGAILALFRAESIFLVNKNWPFLTAFVVAGITYYFTNMYAQKLDIFKTTLIWLAVWGILITLVKYFSVINEPFLSLSAYGVLGAILIMMVFVFLTSHEILSGLYWIVSENSEKGKSSLPQVLIITAVFLVNAVLIYLENANRIDKSTFVFAPIIIYLINLKLGFWGFKNISEQKGWFTFKGVGVWIYTGMAVMSTAVIATVFATANEPLAEFIEDFISISFLSVGLCFFVYLYLNFAPMIKGGLPFSKVIYKPPFSRLLFARIVAVFVIFFFFSMKNRFSYFQLQSGLNNAVGDFYMQEGDLKTAETFYKNGANFDLNNQRSNLSLASMAAQADDKINSVYFFQQANTRKPNVFSIIGKSKSLEAESMYFDALFVLKEGLKDFPEDYRLYTNIARLQAKAGVTDSVLVNLDKALQLCKKCEPENVNFLAFWIQNGRQDKLAEMRALAGNASGYGYKANQAALERILGEETIFNNFSVEQDSALDMSRAAYLLNAMSNAKTLNETSVKAADLLRFQEKSINDPLYEQLSWAYANQQYFRENKMAGLKQLTFMAESTSKLAPLYSQNLGLWLMREGAFVPAISRLEKAGDSSSVALLSKSDVHKKLDEKLRESGATLTKDLNLKNYEEVLNKAPLNPYVLVKVSDFLAEKGKSLEAYNTVFYALDFVKDSPILLKTYITRALGMSMFDYAEDGLKKLAPLVNNEELIQLNREIDKKKLESENFN